MNKEYILYWHTNPTGEVEFARGVDGNVQLFNHVEAAGYESRKECLVAKVSFIGVNKEEKQ